MTWRILLVVPLMLTCLSNWDFIGPQCQPYVGLLALIVGILTFCGILPSFCHWVWKNTIYKKGNFQITFVDRPPLPGHSLPVDESPYAIKILPAGSYRLLIKAQAKYGFQVQKMNLRCLEKDGVTAASQSVIDISDVEDFFYGLDRVADGIGGIDGEYANPRSLAENEGLYYMFDLNAYQKPWSGKLSFRAQDSAGIRSVSQLDIEIRIGSVAPSVLPPYPIKSGSKSGLLVRTMPPPIPGSKESSRPII